MLAQNRAIPGYVCRGTTYLPISALFNAMEENAAGSAARLIPGIHYEHARNSARGIINTLCIYLQARRRVSGVTPVARSPTARGREKFAIGKSDGLSVSVSLLAPCDCGRSANSSSLFSRFAVLVIEKDLLCVTLRGSCAKIARETTLTARTTRKNHVSSSSSCPERVGTGEFPARFYIDNISSSREASRKLLLFDTIPQRILFVSLLSFLRHETPVTCFILGSTMKMY